MVGRVRGERKGGKSSTCVSGDILQSDAATEYGLAGEWSLLLKMAFPGAWDFMRASTHLPWHQVTLLTLPFLMTRDEARTLSGFCFPM